MRMILTPRSAGEPRRRRPCSRLSMRGQRSRPCLRIPFEPGTPGEGVDLMHEDGASTTFRRPSPSYRPILLKWRSADEGKSYNHNAFSLTRRERSGDEDGRSQDAEHNLRPSVSPHKTGTQ